MPTRETHTRNLRLRQTATIVLTAIATMFVATAVYAQPSGAVNDLTFNPVTPCAAFDTRNTTGGPATGPVTGGPHTYTVAGLCGVPAGAAAVEINLVAPSPVGNGNIKVAANGATPGGGVVNYYTGETNSNAVPVEVANNQIDIYINNGPTDIRGVILGYYTQDLEDRITDLENLLNGFTQAERTIVVPGSGTPTQNGTDLQNAVAAVNAQSPSLSDPWLIKLEPGTYETNTPVTLNSGVHLQGSGQEATTILTVSQVEGLVTITNSELSDLSVHNLNSSATISKSVLVPPGSVARLTNVNLEAGLGDALHVDAGAQATLHGVTATTSSSAQAALDAQGTVYAQASFFQATSTGTAIQIDNGGDVTLHHSRVVAIAGVSLDSQSGSNFVSRQSEIVGTTAENGAVDCLDTVTATKWLQDTCSP